MSVGRDPLDLAAGGRGMPPSCELVTRLRRRHARSLLFVGIDPGLDGAIGVIDKSGRPMWVEDAPAFALKTSSGKVRRELSPAGMRALLVRLADLGGQFPRVRAAVEQVHAMPKAGSVSMFSFGKGYGYWVGLLAGLGIPYDLVEPARWKKVIMDGMGRKKDAALLRAQQLFPDLARERLALKKHHGRAEALLIAEYRRRLG